jgi:NDP-sugar pyrophosphorylase family protein
MKAVILAGGKGTRLAPYTTVLPKPLIPVGDMPILEIIIRQLKSHGITEIILCVGYLGALLETYFGRGDRWGVSITYSYETEPLGTAGPLGLLDGLTDTFFAMNGDLLTTIDYSAMLAYHRAHGKVATIGLANKDVKIDLGVIESSPDGKLLNYIEKPLLKYKVSMGIYLFEPATLDFVRGAGRIDLPDLMLTLKERNLDPMVYDSNCGWVDIGKVEDHASASDIFQQNRSKYLPGSAP